MKLTKKDIERRFNQTITKGVDWMVPSRFHQITDNRLINKIPITFVMKLSPTDWDEFWSGLTMYLQMNKEDE